MYTSEKAFLFFFFFFFYAAKSAVYHEIHEMTK